MNRILTLLVMTVSLAWTATAQAGEVQNVAVTLPAATTAAQALSNQARLRPYIAAAVARGEGATLLLQSNPDVLSDLVPYAVGTEQAEGRIFVKRPPRLRKHKRTAANAAGCWGAIADQYTYSAFGATLAWIYVRNNGWCGNGYAITWYGGPTFAAWSWGPYCWTGKGADYSWDGWPTWIHSAHWGTVGVSYPWGCLGIRGGKAQVRFAANGYWDRYNDYGF